MAFVKRRFLALVLVATTATAGCGSADRGTLEAKAPAPAGPAKDVAPPPPPAPPADGRAEAKAETRNDENDKQPAQPQPAPGTPATPPSPPSSTALEPQREPSNIIYTARVTMAVYQVEQGLEKVERIAREQGGFLALKHDREITVRVPRAHFDATLAAIDKLGDVIHRDVQAQDVTDEMVDLEIRIKNAKSMQERLRALLQKAAVKEALDIEKELARVTEELERLEGRQKLLRDKIALSTITVAFEPRGATLATSRVRLPFPFIQELGLPNLLNLDETK